MCAINLNSGETKADYWIDGDPLGLWGLPAGQPGLLGKLSASERPRHKNCHGNKKGLVKKKRLSGHARVRAKKGDGV